jgi:hypothetical protein
MTTLRNDKLGLCLYYVGPGMFTLAVKKIQGALFVDKIYRVYEKKKRIQRTIRYKKVKCSLTLYLEMMSAMSRVQRSEGKLFIWDEEFEETARSSCYEWYKAYGKG